MQFAKIDLKVDVKGSVFFFWFHRRSYSLDVEVSASGFTKDLERDGALLHPAGPDEEEEDDDYDEDEELDKHSTEDTGEKDEESLDIEEYKHAILELEGLKVSDSHTCKQDEESEGDEEEPGIAPTGSDDEAVYVHDEELKEAEDECPELFDLSTSNKDFKPFRYGNSYQKSAFF